MQNLGLIILIKLAEKSKNDSLNKKDPSASNNEEIYNFAVAHIVIENSDGEDHEMQGAEIQMIVHAGNTDQNEKDWRNVLDIENVMIVNESMLYIRKCDDY